MEKWDTRGALYQGRRFRTPITKKPLKLKRTPSFLVLPLCAIYPVLTIFPPSPSRLGRNVMLANSRFKSVKEDSQFTVFSTLPGGDLFSLLCSLILLPELVSPQLSPLLSQLWRLTLSLSIYCQAQHILNTSM